MVNPDTANERLSEMRENILLHPTNHLQIR